MKQCIITITLSLGMIALNGQPLARHQWKDRLVLIFSNTSDNAQSREQMDRFEDERAEVKDRDLLLYRITPGLVKGPEDLPELTSEWFYKYYKVGKDEFNVILIGKDGGEKLRSEELIPPEKIFELIDSMPMRQAEMKRKTKKRGIENK